MPPITNQQRTLSRRRFDPASWPLPIVYPVTSTQWNAPNAVVVAFPIPLKLNGIPQVEVVGVGMPTTAIFFDADSVQLTYAAPFGPDAVVIVPELAPEWRGLNGEYFTGGSFVAGGGAAGVLPAQVWVMSVQNTDPTVALWTFSNDYDPQSAGGFWVAGLPGTTFTKPAPDQVLVDYAGAITGGNSWQVFQWDPLTWSQADLVWVAPAQGVML